MSTSGPNPHQKLGRSMLFIGWGIGLALLVLGFGRWEEDQYNPNREFKSTEAGHLREVTLDSNRLHHYVAAGEINGHPVTFLLDTGASDVVVPARLAASLQLQPGAAAVALTANGRVEIRRTTIDDLSLGPIRLHNVRASINPGMTGDEVLLGMSALHQVELIQRSNQLTLRQYSP